MSLIFERVRSLGSGGLSYLNFSGLINSGLASFIDSKFSVYNRIRFTICNLLQNCCWPLRIAIHAYESRSMERFRRDFRKEIQFVLLQVISSFNERRISFFSSFVAGYRTKHARHFLKGLVFLQSTLSCRLKVLDSSRSRPPANASPQLQSMFAFSFYPN